MKSGNRDNGIAGQDETIAGRLDAVKARIERACVDSGRDPLGVRLVVVSKNFGPEEVAEAINAGAEIIGESRVQEAEAKMPLCPGGARWHMIGHLQRNKVARAVDIFDMIHSVDSLKLLMAVESACESAGKSMPVCIEVNTSGESSKFGLPPEDLPAIINESMGLTRVSVVGLMTIPPFDADPERARPFFSRLREMRDDISVKTGVDLSELSMGMTNDLEAAVKEGATYVRVGTAIFGERKR